MVKGSDALHNVYSMLPDHKITRGYASDHITITVVIIQYKFIIYEIYKVNPSLIHNASLTLCVLSAARAWD